MFGLTNEDKVLAQLIRIADALERAWPELEQPEMHTGSLEPSVSVMSDENSWEEEQAQAKIDRYR